MSEVEHDCKALRLFKYHIEEGRFRPFTPTPLFFAILPKNEKCNGTWVAMKQSSPTITAGSDKAITTASVKALFTQPGVVSDFERPVGF